MHGRTLFPHRKSRGYHEGLFIYFRFKIVIPEIVSVSTYQRQTLDKKRPKAEESFHDKPGDDTLDL